MAQLPKVFVLGFFGFALLGCAGTTNEDVAQLKADLAKTQQDSAVTKAELTKARTELAVTKTELTKARTEIKALSELLNKTGVIDFPKPSSTTGALLSDSAGGATFTLDESRWKKAMEDVQKRAKEGGLPPTLRGER